ncbi:MAG: DMT family transporter [Hyphomicrobiales bacterium]
MKQANTLSIVLMVILGMIWGSSFILIKKGLIYLSADELGALRIVISFLALSPIAIRKLKSYSKSDILYLGLSGLTGSLAPAFLFAFAELKLHSSLAGVLNSLTPIFTLLAGLFFFQLRPSLKSYLGIALGLYGASMLILYSHGGEMGFNNIEYSILPMLGAASYGININLIKKKLSHIPPIEITSSSFFVIGIPAFIYLLSTDLFTKILETPDTIRGIGYVSILSLVGTALALIIFNNLIKMSGPIYASSVTYLIPIFAILWGLFDGEQLETISFLWCGIILIGIFLINGPAKEKAVNKLDIKGGKLKKVKI